MPLSPAPVFSRAEARSAGWSDSALDRAIRAGRVFRLRRDQFTSAPPSEHFRLSAIAAARSCHGSVVSHGSAATLHKLPMLGRRRDDRPAVTVPPAGTGDLRGALLHRAQLWPEDVVNLASTNVTSVARTIADLGRSCPTATTVVAADYAIHHAMVELAQIEDVLLRAWIWPGIRRAWRSLALVDGRAESPLESVSRLVLGWMRVAAAKLQTPLYDERGLFVGRVDFYWPEFGEADGRIKYDDRSVLFAEKRRQEALEDLGLIVVRWDWTDVTRRPRLLAKRLQAAFERGRLRDRSGFPRQRSATAA